MPSFLGSWLVLFTCTLAAALYQQITGISLTRFSLTAGLVAEIGIFIIWAVYWTILYPAYFTPFLHLPTPAKRNPVTGNLDECFPDYQWKTVRQFYHDVANNGLMRYYSTMSVERLLVTNPNALRDMLNDNGYDFGQSSTFKLLVKRVTGSTFSFTTNEVKAHRKSFMPAFTVAHIRELTTVFWGKCIQMTDCMEAESIKCPKSPISIRKWASRTTLDIIGLAGMGYDFNAIEAPESDIRRHYEGVNVKPNPVFNWIGLLSNFMHLGLLLSLPFKKNREIAEGAAYVRSVARKVIQERQAKIHSSSGVSERKDINSVALASGDFTPEQLVEYVMVFISAGHESTAATFEWAIYELGRNPEMQQRLRDEIRANAVSMHDLDASRIGNLPYLNAICSETLRFYPFTPMVVKMAERDSLILGERIPKGTLISYVPAVTNFDTELWGPSAKEFDPDRWMEAGKAGSGGATSNYAMLSFSAGARNCLGHTFARAELACLVASTVGRFSIKLANPDTAGVPAAGQVLRSREGVHVTLKAIDW